MTATLTLAASSTFIRRTYLADDEQRTNFTQADNDALDLVSSDEAAAVTPHMTRIYTRLLRAPRHLFTREGVLHFTGETTQDGTRLTALDQLARHCGVARATLLKAVKWMHTQSVIGYDSYKNGAGIFIFLNRAAASIRKLAPAQRAARPTPPPQPAAPRPVPALPAVISPVVEAPAAPPPVAPGSTVDARSSTVELPSKVFSFGEGEDVLENNYPPHGATTPPPASEPAPSFNPTALLAAVAELMQREHERIREWFERQALPKVARVAHAESYKVLRRAATPAALDTWRTVGRHDPQTPCEPVTAEMIAEYEAIRRELDAEHAARRERERAPFAASAAKAERAAPPCPTRHVQDDLPGAR